jgi:hypothetical protein
MPPPSRLRRAISSGALDYDNGRKALSFRDNAIIEMSDRREDDVASDDDKNKIELIEDEFVDREKDDIPKLKEIDP